MGGFAVSLPAEASFSSSTAVPAAVVVLVGRSLQQGPAESRRRRRRRRLRPLSDDLLLLPSSSSAPCTARRQLNESDRQRGIDIGAGSGRLAHLAGRGLCSRRPGKEAVLVGLVLAG